MLLTLEINQSANLQKSLTFSKIMIKSAVIITIVSMTQVMAANAASPNLYKVQKGDTLLGVANKFHISAKQLAKDNKKQLNDGLVMNEILLLSNELFTTSATSAKPSPYKLHAVKTTVATNVATKPLTTSHIAITKTSSTTTAKNPFYDASQTLTKTPSGSQIKAKPLNIRSYTIQNGDSLTSLAKKYNTTISHLQQLNPSITTQKLTIGQKLFVPAMVSPIISPATAITTNNSNTLANTKSTSKITIENYNVKEGDTLTAVANRYNLTVNDIAKINQIMPDMTIKIGQTLMIPVSSSNNNKNGKY